jgi:hypothetical protein
LANSIRVNWTADESTVTASFSIFVKVGAGAFSLAGTVSAASRTFTYGNIPSGTTYSFYVRANGVSGLNRESSFSSVSLSAPPTVGALSASQTTTSAAVSWTVPAGVYQRFHVYTGGTYLGEVLATQSGTSYSFNRTGLSQSTAYNFRVYAQNYDGYFSTFSELDVTTNTLPIPSISWSDNSATKYSDWSITWTGTAGITYQPEYFVSSWLNNGGTLSGAGAKTSPTQSVGYGSTLYMRVYVTDAFGATGHTSQIQVTAGRPLITSTTTAGWGAESGDLTKKDTINSKNGNYANGTNLATQIGWGDETAISIISDANTDRKVTGVSIKASKISGFTGSLTSNVRRIVVRLNSSTARQTYFDGNSATKTETISHTLGYLNTRGDRTAYYGVRDAISTWRTITNEGTGWKYENERGNQNFWPSDRTSFEMTVTYRERSWVAAVTTTTQTQVNSTYA